MSRFSVLSSFSSITRKVIDESNTLFMLSRFCIKSGNDFSMFFAIPPIMTLLGLAEPVVTAAFFSGKGWIFFGKESLDLLLDNFTLAVRCSLHLRV